MKSSKWSYANISTHTTNKHIDILGPDKGIVLENVDIQNR